MNPRRSNGLWEAWRGKRVRVVGVLVNSRALNGEDELRKLGEACLPRGGSDRNQWPKGGTSRHIKEVAFAGPTEGKAGGEGFIVISALFVQMSEP